MENLICQYLKLEGLLALQGGEANTGFYHLLKIMLVLLVKSKLLLFDQGDICHLLMKSLFDFRSVLNNRAN